MIVAVTGTPGTGKSSVAAALAEELDHKLVDVNEVAKSGTVETERDERRDADAVDIPSLVEALQQRVPDDAVLDGHLSHHFPADLTVVLRCSPDELEERLAGKGWDEEKIVENVQAESMDVILQEAVAERDEVIEIDTTARKADDVAKELAAIIEDGSYDDHRPGQVDWQVAMPDPA
ncbi:MAG: adenylate kinase family protein [Candidatus Nanohaloarchaea archaeon]|nr:adenylate kinase family protein [Candidatus Nanohaloarchaea archaeon]